MASGSLRRWALVVGLGLVCSMTAGGAAGATVPVAVSPGGIEKVFLVEHRCPTFSWSAVPEATGYELLVFPLEGAEPAVEPVIHELLPATSWTPAVGHCLEPGAGYGWSVRSVGPEGPGPWAEGRYFEVDAQDPLGRIEEAVRAALSALAAEGRLSKAEAHGLERLVRQSAAIEAPVRPAAEGGSPDLGTRSLEGTAAAIQGQLEATSGAEATTTSGLHYGVYARSSSTQGRGVFGWASDTSGDNVGVWGETSSTRGGGVLGLAPATSGNTYGVLGLSSSTFGNGVFGGATATSGSNVGVYGLSHSTSGRGVYGRAVGTSGNTYGVYGETSSTGGRGVFGRATTTSGHAYGVEGHSSSTQGRGVVGLASATSGTTYGVYGQASSTDGYAGYFQGRLHATGNISTGGTKNFKIDHPLDPENQYLYHFALESDEVLNFYSGNVVLDASGEAWVELPEWFAAINRDFRYQLTAIGLPGPNLHVAQQIEGSRFKIGGGPPAMEVSWTVTAQRADPWVRDHAPRVEVEKAEEERGRYLYPAGYGQSEERGLH